MDAIKQEIVLKNPQTFIWLYRFNKELKVYYFDVLDDDWDILFHELGVTVYRKLFDDQLTHIDAIIPVQVNEHIKKYDKLGRIR